MWVVPVILGVLEMPCCHRPAISAVILAFGSALFEILPCDAYD